MAKSASRSLRSLLLLPPLALCTGACGGWATAPDPAPAVATAAPTPAPAPAPAPPAPSTRALEERVAELELRLLEAQAQNREIQARLDDARREVVRAMAKMQTLATRAEAASGMAEAEIALQALPPAAAQASAESNELMRLSTAEFDKGNYAGALYLASQAKNVAAAARTQLAREEQLSARPFERSFAVPLPLLTTSPANVREGPGVGFGVLFVVPAGAPLTGHSAAQQWLRVTDESGRRGWISQTLIRARL